MWRRLGKISGLSVCFRSGLERWNKFFWSILMGWFKNEKRSTWKLRKFKLTDCLGLKCFIFQLNLSLVTSRCECCLPFPSFPDVLLFYDRWESHSDALQYKGLCSSRKICCDSFMITESFWWVISWMSHCRCISETWNM